MGEVSTIGLDIAKSVFQVHGVDSAGAVVIRRRIGCAKVLEFFGGLSPCLIGIEACPSAHHWSRELQALGHTLRWLLVAGNLVFTAVLLDEGLRFCRAIIFPLCDRRVSIKIYRVQHYCPGQCPGVLL
jgi:hypothetical protein